VKARDKRERGWRCLWRNRYRIIVFWGMLKAEGLHENGGFWSVGSWDFVLVSARGFFVFIYRAAQNLRQ
jgi:hypothetical protein